MLSNIKDFVQSHSAEIILVIGVVLISLLSFSIGYITASQSAKAPLQIQEAQTNAK